MLRPFGKMLAVAGVLLAAWAGDVRQASAHWGLFHRWCCPRVATIWVAPVYYVPAVPCCDGWWPAWRPAWRHHGWSCCWWDCCYPSWCCDPCWVDCCGTETVVSASPVQPAGEPTLAPARPEQKQPGGAAAKEAPKPSTETPPSPLPSVPKPEPDTSVPSKPALPGPFRGTSFSPSLPSNAGLLTVHVPADAEVYINGDPTRSTGSRREYVSFGLEPGKVYRYEIKALVACTPYLAMDGKLILPDGTTVVPDKDQTIVYPDGKRVTIDGTVTAPDGTITRIAGTKVTPSNRERDLETFPARLVIVEGKESTVVDWRVREFERAVIEKPNGLKLSVIERVERDLAGEPRPDQAPQYVEKSRTTFVRLWSVDGTIPEDSQPVTLPNGGVVLQRQAIVMPDGSVRTRNDRQKVWLTRTVTLRAGQHAEVAFTDNATIHRALIAAAE